MLNTKILLKEKEIHVKELALSLSKKISRDDNRSLLYLIKEINDESNFIKYSSSSNNFKTKTLVSIKNDTTASVSMKQGEICFKAIVGGFLKKDENLVTAIILLGRALSVPVMDIILENINNSTLIPVPKFIFQEKHPLNDILRTHKI